MANIKITLSKLEIEAMTKYLGLEKQEAIEYLAKMASEEGVFGRDMEFVIGKLVDKIVEETLNG